jgi:hypothetical protein
MPMVMYEDLPMYRHATDNRAVPEFPCLGFLRAILDQIILPPFFTYSMLSGIHRTLFKIVLQPNLPILTTAKNWANVNRSMQILRIRMELPQQGWQHIFPVEINYDSV